MLFNKNKKNKNNKKTKKVKGTSIFGHTPKKLLGKLARFAIFKR